MRFAVTGATGYIGRQLVRSLVLEGSDVLVLSRSKPIQADVEWNYFDLNDVMNLNLPVVDVVIHLAANTKSEPREGNNEIDAAMFLIEQAKLSDARFIFVSSQTATSSASSDYGETKRSIEQIVLSSNGIVVRPGQVYGGEPLGLFGSITELVAQLPVLPLLFPEPCIQPVHIDDLVTAIKTLSASVDDSSRVYSIGCREPVRFSSYLRATAKHRLRVFRPVLPIPMRIIRLLAILAGPKSSIARLDSLNSLDVMTTKKDLDDLGLMLRPLKVGMQRSGCARRFLLLEASILYRYVLDKEPSSVMLRHYVRAVEELSCGSPLGLPSCLHFFPSLVTVYENSNVQECRWHEDFHWRVNVATTLVEASQLGAQQFLGVGKRTNFLRAFFLLAYVVCNEFVSRVLRLLFKPFLFKKARKWREFLNEL